MLRLLRAPAEKKEAVHDTCYVTSVIDGDTFRCRLRGRIEKIRLIGVNTPEVHHPRKGVEFYGKEAQAFARRVLTGKQVGLEYDVQLRDRYGRILAYVYLPSGDMFNALLVKEGYAQVMTVPPNVKYQELFLRLEREAREEGRGLWK